MLKVVGSALTRTNEFSAEGLHSSDRNVLFCKFCNGDVSWEHRDTIIKHINSEKHVNNKIPYSEKKTSLQQTIGSSFQVVNKRKSALKTTAAFLKANIPLQKLQEMSIREWVHEFVEGAGDLPTAKTSREKYVSLVTEERFATVKAEVDGKFVTELADETTGKRGNCQVKGRIQNIRKCKHTYTQFVTEKYPDGTKKMIQCPVPVLTRLDSSFKSVLYVSENLTDMIEFFSSSRMQITPNAHAAKLMSLIDSFEGYSYPTSHILHSKLLHVKGCFAVATSGIFRTETTSLIEELGYKVLQAEVKQMLQRTATLSMVKLQEQMSIDPCRKTFAVLDNLLNPSSVVLNDVNHSLVTSFQTLPGMKCINLTSVDIARSYTRFK
ncbi:hypothetical protein PR048_007584 [Dryococelus australis]|uniref:Uncharacterized protein n=1 Tax=Dryococelus australis TaxID=614101 RepID=A0ABQ9HV28_9NEOP|nr:hypothetical protein PR048_007584 [Dryococelus australis]